MMSHVRITHYFYAKMKAKKNGVICFTASSVINLSFLTKRYHFYQHLIVFFTEQQKYF